MLLGRIDVISVPCASEPMLSCLGSYYSPMLLSTISTTELYLSASLSDFYSSCIETLSSALSPGLTAGPSCLNGPPGVEMHCCYLNERSK